MSVLAGREGRLMTTLRLGRAPGPLPRGTIGGVNQRRGVDCGGAPSRPVGRPRTLERRSTAANDPMTLSRRYLVLLPAASLLLAACTSAPHRHGGMHAEERCATYRAEMAGKSPAEQRAAAAAHIRAMHGSADEAHIDRHLAMMAKRCGAAAPGS